MILVLLIALSLLAVAAAAAVTLVYEPSLRRAENLDQIGAYGYVGRRSAPLATKRTRLSLDSIAAAIGDLLVSRIPRLREEDVQARLVAAGCFTIGPRTFIGYQALLTVGLPVVLFLLLALAGAPALLLILAAVGAACAGFVGPGIVLGQRARTRLREIDDRLPELIDLLVVTLEAGVGFTAALKVASDRLAGPLGDELRLTIQEQNLGLSTMKALENWLERTDTPALRSFVRAMVQGETLGVSIGQILRNLALEMRRRQQQVVEERAQKAPIKMLFPLVFLIFPAMFVVMLGPVLYRMGNLFGGG